MTRPLHVGCSGWNYRDWRGSVYPEGLPQRRWLEGYAEMFRTVEVNATFYRLQKPETTAHWVEQTPKDFVFAVKASRYLSHIKRLKGVGEGLKRFDETIEPLREAGKLGPILWQLPENFQRDDERLHSLLEADLRGRHCIEFRHPSWFASEVMAALRDAGLALVIGHHPERPFQTHELTADWTYVRFHYGGRGRGGNYSERELAEWKRRIAAWRAETEVFAYFNNDWKAYAPRNAQKLGGG